MAWSERRLKILLDPEKVKLTIEMHGNGMICSSYERTVIRKNRGNIN